MWKAVAARSHGNVQHGIGNGTGAANASDASVGNGTGAANAGDASVGNGTGAANADDACCASCRGGPASGIR